MSSNDERSFKIISNLVEVLSLEEEEFNELDAKFEKIFKEDFSLELKFLASDCTDKEKSPNIDKKDDNLKSNSGFLKRLHKQLAIKTHPDKRNGDTEAFKIIQAAYENFDVARLFKAALEYDIKLSISEEDKKDLSNQIRHKRQKLEQRRQNVRWAWCETQEKTEEMREQILGLLKLDKSKFEEWKKADLS